MVRELAVAARDPTWNRRGTTGFETWLGYAFGMKTVISVPDKVFQEADRFGA